MITQIQYIHPMITHNPLQAAGNLPIKTLVAGQRQQIHISHTCMCTMQAPTLAMQLN